MKTKLQQQQNKQEKKIRNNTKERKKERDEMIKNVFVITHVSLGAGYMCLEAFTNTLSVSRGVSSQVNY